MTLVRMGATATSSASNGEYFNGMERKVKSQVGLGGLGDGWSAREVRGKEENGEEEWRKQKAGRQLARRLKKTRELLRLYLLTKARA